MTPLHRTGTTENERPDQTTSPVETLIGGTGGIRTPGTFQFVRFQGGCIRPLCHRSVFDDTGLCCVLPGEVPERPNGMPC